MCIGRKKVNARQKDFCEDRNVGLLKIKSLLLIVCSGKTASIHLGTVKDNASKIKSHR